MIVENILAWCLFPLALAGVASFASAIYDDFASRRRKQTISGLGTIAPREIAAPEIAAPEIAAPEPPRPITLQPIVRGYDTPELFRQDCWLLRIDRSRTRRSRVKGSLQSWETTIETHNDYERRVCAVLAQRAGARGDN